MVRTGSNRLSLRWLFAVQPLRLLRWQKAALCMALAAAATGLALLPGPQALMLPVEHRVQDDLFLWRGRTVPPGLPIVLVLVDARGLAPYPFRIPTPRALLADTVRRLDSLGARCIALDFLLNRPTFPSQDASLARALDESRAKIVLPVGALPSFARRAILASPVIGLDAQGRARTIRYLGPGEAKPSISWALDQACTSAPLAAAPRFNRPLALNYLGPPSHLSDNAPTFPVFSTADLKHIPRSLIAGRIVMVGTGETNLGDTFDTPFTWAGNGHRQSFGVELHATALAMLLTGRFLLPVPATPLTAALFGLFALTAWAALAGSFRGWPVLGLALPLGWLGLAAGLFRAGELLPVALPIMLALGVYLVGQVLLYLTEARYGRFLRTTFSRYLSPEIVDQLVARRLPVAMGGNSAEVTVLFADLADFTSIAERLTPEQLVSLLNAYFGRMSDVILAEQGTIADLMGDGIMAYFGAPVPYEDHRERACRAALAMQTELRAMQGRSGRVPDFHHMRIGLHSGPVVVGNIGSARHSDFTIVGDTVNVASRLEGVNKVFGTSIIASEAVRVHNRAEVAWRELGRVVVKGRTNPTTLYEVRELVRPDSAVPKNDAPGRDLYQRALEAFYSGRLAEAQGEFERAARRSADPAARFMAKQCEVLAERPLPADWNGTLELRSK